MRKRGRSDSETKKEVKETKWSGVRGRLNDGENGGIKLIENFTRKISLFLYMLFNFLEMRSLTTHCLVHLYKSLPLYDFLFLRNEKPYNSLLGTSLQILIFLPRQGRLVRSILLSCNLVAFAR